jgi:nicotinamidase-related amidase
MYKNNVLQKDQTALVIIDVQEAFRKIIPEFDLICENLNKTIAGFKVLELPIIITEQYPKGLGHTAPELLEILPEKTEIIEKSTFSSCGQNDFVESLNRLGIKQILLGGLETHICVNQTVHDLVNNDFKVHLLFDAVGSRTDLNKNVALEKMKLSGVIPTTVEMSLFELLQDSKHESFKEIQKIIK